MVNYFGGIHSRVVLLGIFYVFTPKYLFRFTPFAFFLCNDYWSAFEEAHLEEYSLFCVDLSVLGDKLIWWMFTMWCFPLSMFFSCWWWNILVGFFPEWFSLVSFMYFSPFASFLDDYWGNFGEVLKFNSFSAYFFLYLETNYFGECSPCGISPSACIFVLVVKYFDGVHSRVVLLGIFFCYSLILLF